MTCVPHQVRCCRHLSQVLSVSSIGRISFFRLNLTNLHTLDSHSSVFSSVRHEVATTNVSSVAHQLKTYCVTSTSNQLQASACLPVQETNLRWLKPCANFFPAVPSFSNLILISSLSTDAHVLYSDQIRASVCCLLKSKVRNATRRKHMSTRTMWVA